MTTCSGSRHEHDDKAHAEELRKQIAQHEQQAAEAERLTMTLGGGTYTGPVAAEAKPGDSRFRPTHLMERASREIERETGLTGNELLGLMGSKRAPSLKALSLLAAEGYVDRERDGQAHRHHFVKPYREADDPLSDKYEGASGSPGSQPVPDRFPEPAGELVPPVPSSVGGTGNRSSNRTGQPVPDDEVLADEAQAELDRLAAKGLA